MNGWIGSFPGPWPGSGAGPPEQVITLLHGFPPGGGADLGSRLVAAPLAEQPRAPMLVEGRPGAGGNIAGTALARAAPDGYLIGLPTGSHAVNAAFGRVQGYDPVEDFARIVILLHHAFVPVVAPAIRPAIWRGCWRWHGGSRGGLPLAPPT